jgi:hypothetical protein
MAVLAGAKNTYSEPIGTGGNREDLSDVLYDISPTDTPFVTMCKKGKATATKHEWLTDALTPAAKNAQPEGQVAVAVKPGNRVRLGNQTQIFSKYATVTGSQEKADKAGVKSEMAYQVARRMKEIKMDLEFACIGSGYQIAVAGSESVAREMASFQSFMSTNVSLGAGGVAGTGDGSDVYTPGAARPFTEDLLTAALASLWEISNGSESITALMGKDNRAAYSTFDGSSTRYVSTDKRKLTASIDVYDGDFHTVTAMPSRHVATEDILLIDKDYVAIDDFRPLFSEDISKTGDGMTKQIIMETTLRIGNPLAHYVITDAAPAVGP